jgi:hypothetical protein
MLPALYELIYMYGSANENCARDWGIRLPEFFIKPFKHDHRIFHVFLRLLPHVEDRTVFTRAQDVLETSGHPPVF